MSTKNAESSNSSHPNSHSKPKQHISRHRGHVRPNIISDSTVEAIGLSKAVLGDLEYSSHESNESVSDKEDLYENRVKYARKRQTQIRKAAKVNQGEVLEARTQVNKLYTALAPEMSPILPISSQDVVPRSSAAYHRPQTCRSKPITTTSHPPSQLLNFLTNGEGYHHEDFTGGKKANVGHHVSQLPYRHDLYSATSTRRAKPVHFTTAASMPQQGDSKSSPSSFADVCIVSSSQTKTNQEKGSGRKRNPQGDTTLEGVEDTITAIPEDSPSATIGNEKMKQHGVKRKGEGIISSLEEGDFSPCFESTEHHRQRLVQEELRHFQANAERDQSYFRSILVWGMSCMENAYAAVQSDRNVISEEGIDEDMKGMHAPDPAAEGFSEQHHKGAREGGGKQYYSYSPSQKDGTPYFSPSSPGMGKQRQGKTRMGGPHKPHRLLISTACYVLDQLMSALRTHRNVWSRIRRELFAAVFLDFDSILENTLQEEKRRRKEEEEEGRKKKFGNQEGGNNTNTEDDNEEEEDGHRFGDEKTGALPASVFSKLTTCYDTLVSTRIHLHSALEAYAKKSAAMSILSELQDSTSVRKAWLLAHRVLLEWKEVAQKGKRKKNNFVAFTSRQKKNFSLCRLFYRWRRVTLMNKQNKTQKKWDESRDEVVKLTKNIQQMINAATEETGRELFKTRSSLSEERELRERQFAAFTYEISTLTESEAKLKKRVDGIVAQKKCWRHIWRENNFFGILTPVLPSLLRDDALEMKQTLAVVLQFGSSWEQYCEFLQLQGGPGGNLLNASSPLQGRASISSPLQKPMVTVQSADDLPHTLSVVSSSSSPRNKSVGAVSFELHSQSSSPKLLASTNPLVAVTSATASNSSQGMGSFHRSADSQGGLVATAHPRRESSISSGQQQLNSPPMMMMAAAFPSLKQYEKQKSRALLPLKEKVEAFLVNWVNYQLNLVAFDRSLLTPMEDLADGEIYLALTFSIRHTLQLKKNGVSSSSSSSSSSVSTENSLPQYKPSGLPLVQCAKRFYAELKELLHEGSFYPFIQPLLAHCPYVAEYCTESRVLFAEKESWCFWLLSTLFVVYAGYEVAGPMRKKNLASITDSSNAEDLSIESYETTLTRLIHQSAQNSSNFKGKRISPVHRKKSRLLSSSNILTPVLSSDSDQGVVFIGGSKQSSAVLPHPPRENSASTKRRGTIAVLAAKSLLKRRQSTMSGVAVSEHRQSVSSSLLTPNSASSKDHQQNSVGAKMRSRVSISPSAVGSSLEGGGLSNSAAKRKARLKSVAFLGTVHPKEEQREELLQGWESEERKIDNITVGSASIRRTPMSTTTISPPGSTTNTSSTQPLQPHRKSTTPQHPQVRNIVSFHSVASTGEKVMKKKQSVGPHLGGSHENSKSKGTGHAGETVIITSSTTTTTRKNKKKSSKKNTKDGDSSSSSSSSSSSLYLSGSDSDAISDEDFVKYSQRTLQQQLAFSQKQEKKAAALAASAASQSGGSKSGKSGSKKRQSKAATPEEEDEENEKPSAMPSWAEFLHDVRPFLSPEYVVFRIRAQLEESKNRQALWLSVLKLVYTAVGEYKCLDAGSSVKRSGSLLFDELGAPTSDDGALDLSNAEAPRSEEGLGETQVDVTDVLSIQTDNEKYPLEGGGAVVVPKTNQTTRPNVTSAEFQLASSFKAFGQSKD